MALVHSHKMQCARTTMPTSWGSRGLDSSLVWSSTMFLQGFAGQVWWCTQMFVHQHVHEWIEAAQDAGDSAAAVELELDLLVLQHRIRV